MPSLIPGFEYDIFISYRQKDNKGDRWVTEFVKALKTELEATFKEEVNVYFDESPHDGLLETHQVGQSLSTKIKSLVFIPIISQTYCDPKSFAWQHEFLAFMQLAREDNFGKDITVSHGNVSSRVLPVKIHELDPADTALLENELGGPVRSVNFIYTSAGVNRPLRVNEDNPSSNLNKTFYRDQINKVANAVKEIILAMENRDSVKQSYGSFRTAEKRNVNPTRNKRKILTLSAITVLFVALTACLIFYFFIHKSPDHSGKSIAVLPFENLSGDPSQEYFGDGIAEEIRNALSQLNDLKVPGRSSSLQFKGKSVDLTEVGKKLKVSAVLEGSVRRQGNRVRIDVELISVENGYHLWSQQFERTVSDIFAIQEEIAIAVTQRLKVTLLQNEKIEIGEGLTKNSEAYDAFLKGRYFWIRRELKESEKYFKQAIVLDSTYASAYAGLAETYIMFPFFQVASPHESMPKAQVAAESAIQQDSLLAIPYLVLAFKNTYYDLNPDKARKYFNKGLSLNPKYAEAHYWYGYYLAFYESDLDGSIAENQKAVDLEPLGSIPYACLGWSLMMSKRFQEGSEMNRIAIELNKQNALAYPRLGECLMGLGHFKEARKILEESVALTSNEGSQVALVYLDVKDGDRVKALELFNGMVKRSQSTYVSPVMIGAAASYLVKRDVAHEYLKKAFKEHDVWIVSLINNLRHPHDLFTDPRNVALMDLFFGKVPNARYRMPLSDNQ